jgi:capsular polysaccharide biosynthesis protein
MTGSNDWRAVVRREWLVVTTVAVAAAVVAAGLSLAARPKAVATTEVLCEQRTLVAYTGIPTADAVISSMHSHEANAAVAGKAGVQTAVVSAALRVAAVAAPLYGVGITVTLDDEAAAARIASAAASEAASRAAALDAAQIERYRARAELDAKALAVLEPAAAAGPANADLAFKLWTVRVAATDDTAASATLKDAYHAVGEVAVSRPSPLAKALQNMMAAAVVGLAIGLALAALRERMSSRG